jgi:hypothetical protein
MSASMTMSVPALAAARRSVRPATAARHPGRSVLPVRLLLVAAAVELAVTIPSIPDADSTVFGLLFGGGAGVAIALVLGLLGFLSGARARSSADMVAGIAVVMAATRLPAILGSSMPTYSWTYKHLGVVDYIVQNGRVSENVDIYSGWPGAFAAIAWSSQITGISSVEIARWFPLGVHIAIAVGVYALARGLRSTPHVALVAVLIAEVVNWVGQDYLSPQAVALVLGIGVLALLAYSSRRPALGYFALLPFAAVVVSHQLTPYWLIGAALVLGLARLVRPRSIGILFVLVAGGYLATHLGSLDGHSLFSGFDLFANARTNTGATTSDGQIFTGLAAKAAAAALWAGAAIVLVRAVFRRRIQSVIPAAAMGFAPFALLAVQNYGGEAVYRVFLYSIPGCAVLCAPILLGLARAPARRPLAIGTATAAALLVGLASLQASYGGWFSNLVQRDAYSAVTSVLENSPPSTLLLSAAPGAPSRTVGEYTEFAQNDQFFDLSLSSWAGWHGQSFADGTVAAVMTDDLLDTGRPAYVLVTAQMEAGSDYYGLYPPGSIERFASQLAADPRWETVEATGDMTLFRLRGA